MRMAVGIPSYREADTIAYVVRQVDEGLLRLADPSDCLIINADGNSPDRTSRVFLDTPTRCRKQSLLTADHAGKGSNVFNILRYCREHDVEALALMDADLSSVTSDWAAACVERGVRAEREEEIRSLADQLFPLWRVRMIGFSRDNFHRSAKEIEAEIEYQRRLFSGSLRRRI